MIALSLWRPWDEAVVGVPGGPIPPKPWENRDWPPWNRALSQVLAIHATMHYDQDGAAFCRDQGVSLLDRHHSNTRAGAIVGVCRLKGWVELDSERRKVRQAGLLPEQVASALSSPWVFGPYAWLLSDRWAIDPVPCRGKQGLWRPPPEVAKLVMERYRAVVNAALAASREVRV